MNPSSDSRNERLAQALSTELLQVLTSKRYRTVMRLVRLRNWLLGRQEEDPLEAHLLNHLRLAGWELPSDSWSRVKATGDGLNGRAHVRLRGWLRRFGRTPRREAMPAVSPRKRLRLARKLLHKPQDRLISVILPSWNRAGEIGRAIRSVQSQSYRNWELFIVDDGSQDQTAGVVDRLAAGDHRIRYDRLPSRKGVSAARNFGLGKASGEIVAYLDSDNCWDEHYLLFIAEALSSRTANCAYGRLEIRNLDTGGPSRLLGRRFDQEALLRNNYIDLNVFAHKVELFRQLGGFDEDLRRWVDWDLVLRYTRSNRPVEVPAAGCVYQRRAGLNQITSVEPQAYKFKVLNKHLIDWNTGAREVVKDRVSIITLNHDRAQLTSECLRSIDDHSSGWDYEVILVDNGSPANCRRSLRRLARSQSRVRLVENHENLGFSLGSNIGAARTSGEFLVFLNNDTRVTPRWLDGLIQPLREDPSIGLAAPKSLWPDGRVQHAGLVFNTCSKIPYHLYEGFPGDRAFTNKQRRLQAVSGVCLALRRSDFLQLKGFDTLYLNGCEDLDFCFRMRIELGKHILLNPRSQIYHYVGQTAGRLRHVQENRKRFVSLWRDRIVADDRQHYAQDGLRIGSCSRRESDTDDELAAPCVVLEDRGAPVAALGRRNRTLNVGFVSIWHTRGVSIVANQLAQALESSGEIRTHILARWESARFCNSGPVHHPRVLNGGDRPPPRQVVDWARSRGLDLVIFVEVHPDDWKRVESLQENGFRVLACEHLDVLRLDRIDRYRMLDGFIATSFYAGRVFKAEFPRQPTLVLPWGVPEAVLARPTREPAAKGLRFLHVAGWGGMDDRKNTPLCIQAFHEAEMADSRLVVYSQAPLGRYGAEAARIVAANPNIALRQGTFADIARAYEESDVLVWPSKREGLGLPVLESLAGGRPVLISDGFMMKEWPLRGVHAWFLPAEPQSELERVPRYLPSLKVRRRDLTAALRRLASEPKDVRLRQQAVRKDRRFWIWGWQKQVFADKIRQFERGDGFGRDLSDLPEEILEFEQARDRNRYDPPPESENRDHSRRPT